MESLIAQIAKEEVLNPTFELTKQFLSVNNVEMDGGIPRIKDIIISEDKSTAEVYFPIIDEEYYFVIYIDLMPEISLKFMGMSAGNKVELFVSSDTEDLDKMIELLHVTPQRSWLKGEKRIHYNGINFSVNKNSGFIYTPIEKTTGEVEDKIDYLLDELMLIKDKIVELHKFAEVEIQVTYYGYKDQMWGINLKPQIIQRLSELGIPLDIDLYASGNDLP